jgi:hypothetical protein
MANKWLNFPMTLNLPMAIIATPNPLVGASSLVSMAVPADWQSKVQIMFGGNCPYRFTREWSRVNQIGTEPGRRQDTKWPIVFVSGDLGNGKDLGSMAIMVGVVSFFDSGWWACVLTRDYRLIPTGARCTNPENARREFANYTPDSNSLWAAGDPWFNMFRQAAERRR